ncbi:MAG: 7-carboxy-7-deazaguanine synthase QueE [Bacteroidetes bacterium]|nr:MAG: 7-carboxy-7-deazaguanine synthase QueE [Bacteroidota bacterium]
MSVLEDKFLKEGVRLPVMEAFYTIQGEGYHTGLASFFVRIGGCDVGCHWCDVKESWNPEIHPLINVEDVLKNALQYPAKTLVITGGEPSSFNLKKLTQIFKYKGYNIHIETSGAYSLNGHFDWVCLSPKKTSPPQKTILEKANELKVIIYNNDDFKWAEKYKNQVNTNHLYLQPEWSKRAVMLPKIIDYVKAHPEWKISLQTHKYMNIP